MSSFSNFHFMDLSMLLLLNNQFPNQIVQSLLNQIDKVESILMQKATQLSGFCGPDGTRTRDLRRDRAAF